MEDFAYLGMHNISFAYPGTAKKKLHHCYVKKPMTTTPQVDTDSEVEYCTDIEGDDDDDDDDDYDVQDPSVDEDVTASPRPPPFESQEKVNLLVGSLWNGILRNAEDLVWINVKTLKGNCFRLPVDRNGKVEETARHLEDVTGRTLLALRTVHFPILSHLFQDALSHG